MPTASKKVINGWAMYDWANSVYNLVITSTIFPGFYEAVTGDGKEDTRDYVTVFGRSVENTALYNYTLAIAFVIVAIMSPILSSIADYRGNKKQFLLFFCTLGSFACSSLFFFDDTNLMYGLACMLIACVGFWGSIVFYNSFLPEIAAPEDQDKVSAKGFVMGYFGSVLLQIICFVLVLKPDLFGIKDGYRPAQISFLLVGIWWWGFGLFAISRLPKGNPSGNIKKKNLLLGGFGELKNVWQQLSQLQLLRQFLFSFFFYNMGVQTVMLAATLYGKSELGIPLTSLIIAILLIQLIAIPGAMVVSRISSRIGNFRTLIICVIVWIGICITGYLLPKEDPYAFYILAVVVGFVMGGIQSLSRSTYSKLMPVTKDTASFFSFFDVTEKIAIVIGMFSFGFLTDITGSQRSSVLALMVFFIIGLVGLFATLKISKSKQ